MKDDHEITEGIDEFDGERNFFCSGWRLAEAVSEDDFTLVAGTTYKWSVAFTKLAIGESGLT
jgi:hypothetical protein